MERQTPGGLQSARNGFGALSFFAMTVVFAYLFITQRVAPEVPDTREEILDVVARRTESPNGYVAAERILEPEAVRDRYPAILPVLRSGDWIVRNEYELVVYRPSVDEIVARFPFLHAAGTR